MRIAFLVDAFPVLSETFVLNQITGLMDLGHEVDIFAAARPVERDFHADIRRYDLMSRTFYHNDKPDGGFARVLEAAWLFGMRGFRYGPALLRSLNVRRYGREALSLNYFYKAFLFLEAGPFDIAQCHFGPNGNLGVLLKEFGAVRKVVTMFHGYDIRRGLREGPGIYAPLRAGGDCFLSIAPYNRRHLLALGFAEEKIVDHPVGIDVRRFRPGPFRRRGEKTRIITVARFVPEKGLHRGLQVIQRLARGEGRDLQYILVGDGPLQADLMEMVGKYGLEDCVRFIGSEDQQGVARLLREADIYLLPSKEEVLPVVLMEAHAAGLPVVACDVGSVDQIVQDRVSGFLVPGGDVKAMTTKLAWLMDHPEAWEAMGRAGRQRVEERYDIRKLNQRLEEIYREVLAT